MSQSNHSPFYEYDNLALIDQETLHMLQEYGKGNPEVIKDIMDSFAPEAEELIENIRKAHEQENLEALRTSAHSLAGICGSIGALRLKQIAVDMENALKAGQSEQAQKMVPQLLKTYELLLEHLKTL